MNTVWRNLILALVLSFGAVSTSSTFANIRAAEAAGKQKAKKTKAKKATSVAGWRHCGAFMYHDKKGKCVDARNKK